MGEDEVLLVLRIVLVILVVEVRIWLLDEVDWFEGVKDWLKLVFRLFVCWRL